MGNKGDRAVDLNLVAVFARVVDLGSFTAAGKALALPKSSVSRAVSRLEDGLGIRLLQRTTRKLGLTAAGASYLGEVRGPLLRIAEASSEMSELTQEPRGLVRLTLPPEIGDAAISPLLVPFLRKYPRVKIDLIVTNRRVNLVEEGIDLAIRSGVLSDSTLVARKVATSELGLFAAPSYLKLRGRPRRLADLTRHDCIVYVSGGERMPWRLTGPRGVEQVTVTGSATADDFGTVRLLALAGLGISLFPDILVRSDVGRGALLRLLPAYAWRGAATWLVSPPLRHVPTRITLLRDHLLAELAAQLMGTSAAVEPERAQARARAGQRR